MSAVLRVYGEEFDVDEFLRDCTLPVCAVKRRGAPVSPTARPDGTRHDRSGVHVVVSNADFGQFPQQVREATAFLKTEMEQLRRLVRFAGVEDVTLDFGIERNDAILLDCLHLPPEIVRLAGSLGMAVELSVYPPPVEASKDQRSRTSEAADGSTAGEEP